MKSSFHHFEDQCKSKTTSELLRKFHFGDDWECFIVFVVVFFSQCGYFNIASFLDVLCIQREYSYMVALRY